MTTLDTRGERHPGAGGPQALFKTLRRLHGHNLENKGLNDLTEAFQNFVTRARFFSIGRLRRTWSHSAVEFLKYRRRLPALMSDEQQAGEEVDDFDWSSSTSTSRATASSGLRSKHDERKVVIGNISSRVSSNQLKSFLNKFGKVSVCHMPNEFGRQSMYATMPKMTKFHGIAHVTFKNIEGAERAKRASQDELRFYEKVMVVTPFTTTIARKSQRNSTFVADAEGTFFLKRDADTMVSEEARNLSRTFSESSIESGHSDFSSSIISFNASISAVFDDFSPTILERILSFVSPIDRIRLERVNKAWLESAAKAWSHCTTSIAFTTAFTKSNPLRNAQLSAILSRCGMHLQRFSLEGAVHLLDDKAFEIISRHCPNLVEADITGLSGHWRSLRTFGDQLPRLQSLIYRDQISAGDKSFWYLLRGCGGNLRRLDLRGSRRLRGRCLRLFGLLLEEILLDGCGRIDDAAIEDLCMKSSNLRELRLNGCVKISDASISMISRCLTDLRTFTLSGNGFSNLTTNGLLNLTRLDSLTEIAFDQNPLVSNTVIVGFVDGAPGLRSISLANAGSDTVITEDGLMSIAKLKDIRDLNLSCLAAVTNRFLLAIVNCLQLRNLVLRSCTFLGDLGILALAACTKIELVDVSGCLLVSNDSVQKLIRSFPVDSETDCCEAITLIIGGTACDQSRLRPRGSRIVLDTSNYSTLGGYTVPYMDTAMGEEGSDEDISDDEFESLNAQRSFIIDALHDQEDDSPIDDQQILEWAEREARNLGLIKSP